ncbi:MAG: DEAD/DEAH box helicase family protein [Acidobacteria bacterium]|nr:DEAD/DEAH box helicase family protein [Acidobacteriota bacterium]
MAKGGEKKRAHRIRDHRAEREMHAQAVYSLDMAHWAYQTGDCVEAIAYAEKALRSKPNYVRAHALLAEIYFNRQQDYSRAARHFQFLIDHHYDDPSLPYFLGVCYYNSGHYAKARETFADFLEQVKDNPLPTKWKSLKPEAKDLMTRCDQGLALAALRVESVEKQEEREASKKPQPVEKPTAAATEPPPTRAIEPEPRSIGISFSFSEDHLRQMALPKEYQAIEDYRLTLQYHQLTLVKEFEELLCLPLLRNVDHYWYQIETVKKVLKQFRGRALLADEVGLGKTIEAGMVIKEYMLRGLVNRVLILTPASLVSQWQEEMETKFDLEFTTTDSPLYRQDPERFWREIPLILASLQVARLLKNFETLAAQEFDLVVVDEAHYLKNRQTLNWKLVNTLKKKFILLLSATPVQNNLIELYNLITVLKPGLLKTEAQFKREYVKRGNSRLPINSEKLRELVREVMIRNTRSLVDAKLPKRYATTLVVPPSEEEALMYTTLSEFVREHYDRTEAIDHWTLRTLQEEAGSSPFAVGVTVQRLLQSRPRAPGIEAMLRDLWTLTREIKATEKGRRLVELIRGGQAKIIVFTKYLPTLDYLSGLLDEAGVAHAVYRGELSLAEKDWAIALFRDQVNVLLSSESGGEGRNLQFASTIINFDLPWNPMRIEQRIGRLHRIGQTQDVYVFNLCLQGSIEDYMLRVLDKKINMFELVIGEIDTILGNLDSEADFSEIILDLWVRSQTPAELEQGFDELGEQLLAAKARYQETKALDETIFGEDFEA